MPALDIRSKLTVFLTFAPTAWAALERPQRMCPKGPISADPIELAISISVLVSTMAPELFELLDRANEADVVSGIIELPPIPDVESTAGSPPSCCNGQYL